MTSRGTVDHIELFEAKPAWLHSGCRKVTIQVGSEQDRLTVYAKASIMSLDDAQHDVPTFAVPTPVGRDGAAGHLTCCIKQGVHYGLR